MRITFVSNYFNHHQYPLAQAWYARTDGAFCFYETKKISEARRTLGYGLDQKPSYVTDCYCIEGKKDVPELIDDADVVIAGSAPEKMLKKRIRAGKLIFRYSERPLKQGVQPLKYLARLFRWHWRNPIGKPIYMLCASAYTAGDFGKFFLFRNKTYKWGYFPETVHYEDPEAMLAQKNIADILWCGRFLEWKRPCDAVQVAKQLKEAGYVFRLKFIGCGEQEGQLRTMVKEYNLEDCVCFLGSMKPEQVRMHMEKAGIYLFTSNRQEGWGAVLNESMNSGCAVVASHAIGAVPFLVKDGENGLVYKSGDVNMLFGKVKYLLDHPEEQRRLGAAAYRTILDEWNAEVAAERFTKLAECILAGEKKPDLYESGPCSKAQIIKENWFDARA